MPLRRAGAAALVIAGLLAVAQPAYAVSGGSGTPQDTAAYNGVTTTYPKWQVSFKYRGPDSDYDEHFCGGAIIDARWILTAAHCLYTPEGKLEKSQAVEIIYGANCLRGPRPWEWRSNGDVDLPRKRQMASVRCAAGPTTSFGSRVRVSRMIAHPAYDGSNNDIALLELSRPIRQSAFAAPIPLPNVAQGSTDWPAAGQPALVSGWGNLLPFEPQEADDEAMLWPQLLQHAVLTVQPLGADTCDEGDPGEFNKTTMLCASGQPLSALPTLDPYIARHLSDSYDDWSTFEAAACRADSGGPLVVNQGGTWRLAGLVSTSAGCGYPGYPGVFTRVSTYLDWITATTGVRPAGAA